MRRVDLDLITLPMIIQQPKVADKVPPRVAKLAELRRTLQKRVAQLDAPVPRAEDEQARERARNMELDRSVWRSGAERKRGHVHGALRRISPASCGKREGRTSWVSMDPWFEVSAMVVRRGLPVCEPSSQMSPCTEPSRDRSERFLRSFSVSSASRG